MLQEHSATALFALPANFRSRPGGCSRAVQEQLTLQLHGRSASPTCQAERGGQGLVDQAHEQAALQAHPGRHRAEAVPHRLQLLHAEQCTDVKMRRWDISPQPFPVSKRTGCTCTLIHLRVLFPQKQRLPTDWQRSF